MTKVLKVDTLSVFEQNKTFLVFYKRNAYLYSPKQAQGRKNAQLCYSSFPLRISAHLGAK